MGFIKRIIKGVSPNLYGLISSLRFHWCCKRRFGTLQDQFVEQVYRDQSIHVLSGPFQGVAYFNKTVWGPLIPKWIGSYEVELHQIIDGILAEGYERIVDVGAAEGYYAVGLAVKCPQAEVIAFDIDPIARLRQRQLARLNDVSNLRIRKLCDHAALNQLIQGKCLLISDIEGFELDLLDPIRCESLLRCDVLVEVHEFKGHALVEVEQALCDRFALSHDLVCMGVLPRDTGEYTARIPQLSVLGEDNLSLGLSEERSQAQRWIWMKAKVFAA